MVATSDLPPHVLDKIRPGLSFSSSPLLIEQHAKHDLALKLDADRQICRLNLAPEGCPLGAALCPLRHTDPAEANFKGPKPMPSHPRERERLNTVCKHWLRGLCKKGDQCEFLHEFNLRRMPDCHWLLKFGYCSAGDECLYYHPHTKKRICEDYTRGFCYYGPACPRRHIPSTLCPLYAAGFCPAGPTCPQGHPKPRPPLPEAYRPASPPSETPPGPPPPGYGRWAEWDPKVVQARFGGGPLGGAAGGGPGGPGGPGGRDMSGVLCFKCGQKGHFANLCPNRNVPGNRGGLDRTGLPIPK